MRIGCMNCGKSVSSEVPEGTIVRAWVECPECIEKKPKQQFDDLEARISAIENHLHEKFGELP